MKKFEMLLEIAEKLNSPEGCPWDRKQTFASLQAYVLEEAHEVVEAVDSDDNKKIIEELGDLLYTIIFYAKIAQKQGRFNIEDIIDSVKEKLIRRHPHVFGEVKTDKIEEVIQRWEEIKQKEEGHVSRTSALDGIPSSLPALAKAQKMVKKMLHAEAPFLSKKQEEKSEEEIGEALIQIVLSAEGAKIDVEGALRRRLAAYEKTFRAWERA